MNKKILKNRIFVAITILSIFTWLITMLLSPFNGNDSGDLTIVFVILFIRLSFSFIATVIGVMIVKAHLDKTLTIKYFILLALLIINIVILLNTIFILFTLLNFLA